MKKFFIAFLVILTLAGAGWGYAIWKSKPVAKPTSSLPTADTPESRNQLRALALKQLSNALNNYIADKGSLPIKISTVPKAICSSITATCTKAKLVDLNFLTTSGEFLMSIPSDPTGVAGQYSTGFLIAKDPTTGKIVVTAPNAELGAVLSASTK